MVFASAGAPGANRTRALATGAAFRTSAKTAAKAPAALAVSGGVMR